MTIDEKIQLIGQKILILSNNLDKYRQELDSLQTQLNNLKAEKQGSISPTPVIEKVPEKTITPQPLIVSPTVDEVKQKELNIEEKINSINTANIASQQSAPKPKKQGVSFEEQVGAKWFSIVGIIVLVLGIAIGVKYAIDKDLINETTRLVLGYLAGSVILLFALVYKKKYEVFSAILLSGAMAVMYFTTYVGYANYHFYNAGVAFTIMALFTGFTVFAAHIYNYEVIALIGLIGGYSVPMLLSTGSGEIEYLFGFMLILNLGVLALSFVKYWKFVNHVAYGLTWLIFAIWMMSSYDPAVYLKRTLFFATAFYLIFYLSFISYKIFRNKAFSAWDIILVLSNSLIYFGIGYQALQDDYHEKYQGLFCVLNAVFHLAFAVLCKKKEIADKTIFHFIIAMVISFITMAIPVQLEGDHVTLIWVTEMVVLLWMAARFNVNTYKNLAYGIALLAFGSLIQDWSRYAYYCSDYDIIKLFTPLLNHYFLTGIITIAGFWGAWYLNKKVINNTLSRIANVTILVLALLITYLTFSAEINLYFDKQYASSAKLHYGDYGYNWMDYDHTWTNYKILWMLMYTNVFFSLVGFINLQRVKNTIVTYISWIATLVLVLVNFTLGFVTISDLKSFARNFNTGYVSTDWDFNFIYVYLPFLILLIFMVYRYRNTELLKKVTGLNTWLFHVFILTIMCNQLSHILTVRQLDPEKFSYYEKLSYRIGYTVLWGVYSMLLIVYGIIRKRKMLRVIAISLFGLTILKLATDALTMSRGYQLIVFITIGIILLIVSFMYQKFKPLLFGEENENKNEN